MRECSDRTVQRRQRHPSQACLSDALSIQTGFGPAGTWAPGRVGKTVFSNILCADIPLDKGQPSRCLEGISRHVIEFGPPARVDLCRDEDTGKYCAEVRSPRSDLPAHTS